MPYRISAPNATTNTSGNSAHTHHQQPGSSGHHHNHHHIRDATSTSPKSKVVLHTSEPRSRLNSREVVTALDGTAALLANHNNNGDAGGRPRLNSRELRQRSYAKMYQDEIMCLQFHSNANAAVFLLTYVTILVAIQFTMWVTLELFMPTTTTWGFYNMSMGGEVSPSWTLTNAIHCLLQMLYIHWFKGNLLDEQGELNGMTLWEQLEAADSVNIKCLLFLMPTVLTLTACHMANFNAPYCAVNVVLWCICMVAKLPQMNGVRIFGINRTAGIDDTATSTTNTTTLAGAAAATATTGGSNTTGSSFTGSSSSSSAAGGATNPSGNNNNNNSKQE